MLICRNITKSYHLKDSSLNEDVLKDVNLKIKDNEFTALKGPSGSGKSTLLNLISGLDKPTSGEIIFENTFVNKLSDTELAAYRNYNISIVFQFFNLLNDLSVFENIALPLLIRSKNKDFIELKVNELIKNIGLTNRAHHRVSLLSGGESQRVAIARALITEPRLILADEPTGNLDKGNTFKVLELLINSCKTNKTSLLMVTHDLELLEKFDKVYTLESGNLYEF